MATTRGEWSIQEIARAAGVTSRTLRHYDAVGLLRPSRVGENGYRYYDQTSLLRLQRILLLRELGLGLEAIAQVLDMPSDRVGTLRTHLELLELERERIDRQIGSVRRTLRAIERGEVLMPDDVFDGLPHTTYKDEVIERWGQETFDRSDAWWRSLTDDEKGRFGQDQVDIASDFAKSMRDGLAPDSDEALAIAERQYRWITRAWQGRRTTADAFAGLGEMYVADARFTATYDAHGPGTAVFVRDAMKAYAERRLR
jgi:MerR family transcriptional regulator, thiopeptide resistance regulator